MSHWEFSKGTSDEWHTPAYVFEALGERFDLDVAHPEFKTNVPCERFLSERGLEGNWDGFIWMNPPFGGRNGIWPWMRRFFVHGNGIALCPDRTSAPWCQDCLKKADAILFVSPKISFERFDGRRSDSPSTGTLLLAAGGRAKEALLNAERRGLGTVLIPHQTSDVCKVGRGVVKDEGR